MISPAREAGLLGSKGSALALQRPCCRSANLRPPRLTPSSKQLIQYRDPVPSLQVWDQAPQAQISPRQPPDFTQAQ